MATSLESSLTSKGRITIPLSVRRALGLRAHDRVRFALDPRTGQVTLERVPSVADLLLGAIRNHAELPNAPPTREDLERAVAEDVMSEC